MADFVPGEDFLTITVAEDEQNFLGYEVVQVGEDTEIQMSYRGFDHDGLPIEYTAAVRLAGVQGLTASDFRIVTG